MIKIMDNIRKPILDPTICLALQEDAPLIKAIINAAYSKYIERIGRPPAPMTAAYSRLVETRNVYVLGVK